MYMLVIFGYLIYKFKLINQNTASKTTSFLVWVVNPLIILASYQTKFEMEKFKNLGIAFFFSFVSMVFVFVFTHVIFKKNTRMERFALGFGNAGFMGIPLVITSYSIHYTKLYDYLLTFIEKRHKRKCQHLIRSIPQKNLAFINPIVFSYGF